MHFNRIRATPVLAVVLFVALLFAAGCGYTPDEPDAASRVVASPGDMTTPSISAVQQLSTPNSAAAYELRMLSLINARRAEAGIAPLTSRECPDGFADRWSPVMAGNGSLSHQNLEPILSSCSVSTVGENVGMNSSQDTDSMFTAFMASPPHAANILDPRFAAVGIGAYRDANGTWWVTQDFVG